MKSRAHWLTEGKFGLMVHWLAPGPPAQYGQTLTDLDLAVDRFDLERFTSDFVRSGADWLIFTLGQNTGYYASPNQVLDRLAGRGHCSRRDLALEIAHRLKSLRKRFIAYLPCEVYGQSEEIHRAFGWGEDEGTDQASFQGLYSDFIREYAQRFGAYLDGWWFDGAYTWPVFHNSKLNAPLFLAAARAGNPQVAVAFNDGSFCVGSGKPVVADQDYLAGEVEILLNGKIRYGRGKDSPLLDPLHPPAPLPPGCLWHALVPIDCMWAHGCGFQDFQNSPYKTEPPAAGEMEKPIYPLSDLHSLITDFKAAGGGVTFNVGIFQEGGLGEATVAQLSDLSRQI